jgi:hypothetical protein
MLKHGFPALKDKPIMKVRLVIAPDGTIGLFSVTGTFAEGRTTLPAIARALGAEVGIADLPADEVEQHRHDQPHTHQHEEERTHDR